MKSKMMTKKKEKEGGKEDNKNEKNEKKKEERGKRDYVLKRLPEDFYVKEILKKGFEPKERGTHVLVEVEKRGWNSEDVAVELAKSLHLPSRAVAYAGAKDRRAVTVQYMTVKGVSASKISHLKLSSVKLTPLGFVKEPLGLGLLEGNRFIITIRNILPDTKLALPPAVPNYFDEQRFSSHNIIVGKAIVIKDFQEACRLLIRHDRQHGLIVARHLNEAHKDFVGALNRLPHRALKRYLHAYQSKLWNDLTAEYIKSKSKVVLCSYSHGTFAFPTTSIEQKKVPIPGFGSDADESLKPLLKVILEKEGVSLRDFVIKQLPNLSLMGEERNLFMSISDFSLSSGEQDDLFLGREKRIVKFALGKGSYATLLIKALFSLSDSLS